MSTTIKKTVSDYYSDKLKKFGPTPRGVDWNSEQSQVLRFDQLTKLLPHDYSGQSKILDYGCGYGALLDFLIRRYPKVYYTGFDISEEMIATCRSTFQHPFAQWATT